MIARYKIFNMTEGSMFVTALYGLIGASSALSLFVFIWGFVTYISRLGTERRKDGIDIMGCGVRLMVTAIVVIGFLRFVQHWFPL